MATANDKDGFCVPNLCPDRKYPRIQLMAIGEIFDGRELQCSRGGIEATLKKAAFEWADDTWELRSLTRSVRDQVDHESVRPMQVVDILIGSGDRHARNVLIQIVDILKWRRDNLGALVETGVDVLGGGR